MLYQLSYAPSATEAHRIEVVGLGGLEPLTSRLSGGRSNQLSYKPVDSARASHAPHATRRSARVGAVGLTAPPGSREDGRPSGPVKGRVTLVLVLAHLCSPPRAPRVPQSGPRVARSANVIPLERR